MMRGGTYYIYGFQGGIQGTIHLVVLRMRMSPVNCVCTSHAATAANMGPRPLPLHPGLTLRNRNGMGISFAHTQTAPATPPPSPCLPPPPREGHLPVPAGGGPCAAPPARPQAHALRHQAQQRAVPAQRKGPTRVVVQGTHCSRLALLRGRRRGHSMWTRILRAALAPI